MTSFSHPIIFISNASWNYGLPTNRQQLPVRLAHHTQVIYFSPFSLSQAALGRVEFNQYFAGIKEVAPNLFLFHNLQILPLVRGQVWPLAQFDRWLATQNLKRQVRKLSFNKPILWLYFPPSFTQLIGHFDEALTCYHCTDDHAGHAEMLGLGRLKVERDEEQLVKTVDVVFTTSRPLYEQKRQQNPNTYLMPNVANIDHFRPVADGLVTVAPELQKLPRPIAGFVGAVSNYKVNLDLLAETARLLPHWSFVLVGPVGAGDKTRSDELPTLPNLHFIGQRAYQELPAYIAGFDVCLIPYRLNSYTQGVFPLKFWEYLAAGKPVVTTPLPALQAHYEQVEVADDAHSFKTALEKAIRTSADKVIIANRVELASQHSWEKRAVEILTAISSHL